MPVTLTTHIADVRRETPRAALVRLDLGGAPFPYVAGQAVMAGLASGTDRAPYSLASPPQQAARTGCLELLVKVDQKGRAGKHLGSLEPGSAIAVKGPFGTFTLASHADARRLLLIAGGTGIAPLRAMLYDALAWAAPPDICLVYSARTPDDFAFVPELRQLRDEGRITLKRTVTRGAGDDWKGCRRRIDTDLLSPLVSPASTVCLVCGPDSLVEDVPRWLLELGVPAGRIRREEY